MIAKQKKSIFSKILLLIGSLAVLGGAYWFITNMLAPVSAPPVAGQRSAVQFDPKLDISKNERFYMLRQLAPESATPTQIGRPNPFMPVPPKVVVPATSTAPTSSEPVTP